MSTGSANPETEAYYLTQVALASYVGSQFAAGPDLDPDALVATLSLVQEHAAVVAVEQGAAAVGFALDYYESLRASSGVTAPFRPPVIDIPEPEVVLRSLEQSSATLVAAASDVDDDLFLAQITEQLVREAEAATQAAVLDMGLRELVTATYADRAANGWVRVTKVGACSFCRMLAMRGPVYTSESANFRAHAAKDGRGGLCQCTAEPQFGEFEATAQARADQAIWDQVAADGFRRTDALHEFRRRIEGREDGPRLRKPKGRRVRAKPGKWPSGQPQGFDGLTVAQLENQLRVLTGMPDTDYKRRQTARVSARLVELAK